MSTSYKHAPEPPPGLPNDTLDDRAIEATISRFDLLHGQAPSHRTGGIAPRSKVGPDDRILPMGGIPRVRRMRAYLTALAKTGIHRDACLAAGVSANTPQHWKERVPDFAAARAACLELAADRLESEARRRAVDGVEEPVVSQGKVVAYTRRYSDRLLERLLAAKRPAEFSDKVQHQHAHKHVGVVFQIDTSLCDPLPDAPAPGHAPNQLGPPDAQQDGGSS